MEVYIELMTRLNFELQRGNRKIDRASREQVSF